ncbi:MAG TPA: sialidase family protein [Candidatus Thermoplasmatota archaeon]|nr:sialidase family protein [Candidatus Thermoplasmatota archaeon]
MRPLAVVLFLLVAGCAADAPAAERDAAAPERAGAAAVPLVAPTYREPVRLGLVDHSGAEPTILVTPRVVLVAAAPHLWRSLDGGATFEELDASALEGFHGDVDLAADARGTIYYLGLDQGRSTPFQRSTDDGLTWSAPTDLADGRQTDRQWIDARADGTLYVNWRDQDDATDALLFRRSLDGGDTWDPPVAVAPDTIHGPLAHDAATDAVYFAYYEEGLRVARSADGGATWSHHVVTREARDMTLRSGRPIDMFPVVAVDAAGALYLAWAADAPDAPLGAKEATISRVWLAVSTDRGATWTEPRALSPERQTSLFPWVVAGAPGRIAVAWYEARAGAPGHLFPDVWDVVLAQSVDATSADPTFLAGHANRDPVHVGAMCRSGGGCDRLCSDATRGCLPTRVCELGMCFGKVRSRAEFFEMALTPDGYPIVAWVADARAPDVGIEIHVGGIASGTPLR